MSSKKGRRYDSHPGSQEIVWEFRHQNITIRETEGFDAAVAALGLEDAVEAIDRATVDLEPGEYVAWLEENPSAKNALIKINQLRDEWANE